MLFGNDVVVTVPSFIFDATDSGALPGGANITFGKSLSSQGEIIIRAGTLGKVKFLGAVGMDRSSVVRPLTNLTVVAGGGIDIAAVQ